MVVRLHQKRKSGRAANLRVSAPLRQGRDLRRPLCGGRSGFSRELLSAQRRHLRKQLNHRCAERQARLRGREVPLHGPGRAVASAELPDGQQATLRQEHAAPDQERGNRLRGPVQTAASLSLAAVQVPVLVQ